MTTTHNKGGMVFKTTYRYNNVCKHAHRIGSAVASNFYMMLQLRTKGAGTRCKSAADTDCHDK